VTSEFEGLYFDVDALSVLILQLRTGSGQECSSPKHLHRCLTGRRAEKK